MKKFDLTERVANFVNLARETDKTLSKQERLIDACIKEDNKMIDDRIKNSGILKIDDIAIQELNRDLDINLRRSDFSNLLPTLDVMKAIIIKAKARGGTNVKEITEIRQQIKDWAPTVQHILHPTMCNERYDRIENEISVTVPSLSIFGKLKQRVQKWLHR